MDELQASSIVHASFVFDDILLPFTSEGHASLQVHHHSHWFAQLPGCHRGSHGNKESRRGFASVASSNSSYFHVNLVLLDSKSCGHQVLCEIHPLCRGVQLDLVVLFRNAQCHQGLHVEMILRSKFDFTLDFHQVFPIFMFRGVTNLQDCLLL